MVFLFHQFVFLLLCLSVQMGCTIWQSEGRQFLEKQGVEFSASQSIVFSVYKENQCSERPLFQIDKMKLSGFFSIQMNSEEGNQWQLKTFHLSEGQDTENHWVLLQSTGQKSFFCSPIFVPALAFAKENKITEQMIHDFFSSFAE